MPVQHNIQTVPLLPKMSKYSVALRITNYKATHLTVQCLSFNPQVSVTKAVYLVSHNIALRDLASINNVEAVALRIVNYKATHLIVFVFQSTGIVN